MKKALLVALALMFGLAANAALADDQVVTAAQPFDGQALRYVITSVGTQPRYAVILMPGGNGQLPLPAKDGPVTKLSQNFLIRSRGLFADSQIVAASTGATSTPGKIMAIVADLERRFGKLQVYVIGTSRSTEATMSLSKTLDGQVAGFVHTSSLNAIASLDTRNARSRNLIVANEQDACRVTRPSNASANHKNYGTPLILVDGGKSTGDDCEAWAYHGYNGIEKETVDKIKAWIVSGG